MTSSPAAPDGASSSVEALYLSVCRQRGVAADAELACALSRGDAHLHLRAEAHLTILLHVLSTTPAGAGHAATHLTLRAPSLSPAAVGTLATYLAHQTHLTHVSLSGVALPRDAPEVLVAALRTPAALRSSPLRHLGLAAVGLDAAAAVALAPLLARPLPRAFASLDLSNNAANQAGVLALERAVAARCGGRDSAAGGGLLDGEDRVASLQQKQPQGQEQEEQEQQEQEQENEGEGMKERLPLHVALSGNLVTIEYLNAITHGFGAFFALFGGAELVNGALRRGLSTLKVASLATFALSLFILLASSCAYHSVFRHPKLHATLRRADHCSIFLLIAGTYTPFIISYMLDPPTLSGPLTLLAVWLCAAAGIARSAAGKGSNRTRALFALATGWVGIISINTLIDRMQRDAFLFVFAGGMVYSVGLVFYLLSKKIPVLHVLWHIAVMIGSSFHYFALWKYVVFVR